MNYSLHEWNHIFKLDPAKEISDEDLDAICESGTDAVIVGGTDGVTLMVCLICYLAFAATQCHVHWKLPIWSRLHPALIIT